MLDALGNIGDFLGGIGVVVTLAYLAIQIRRNTRAVHASALDSISTSLAEAMEKIAQDPDLTRIWFSGHHGNGDLSQVDGERYFLLLFSPVRRWEIAFGQRRTGALESGAWDGMRTSLETTFRAPGARERWPAMRPMLEPKFVRYVDQLPSSARER